MKIRDEFFDSLEAFEVFEAEYSLFCDVLNAEERYNIVKKEFENDMELRGYENAI